MPLKNSACYTRNDAKAIVRAQFGFESVQKAHIFFTEKHVDEVTQLVVLKQMRAQIRVLRRPVIERRADGFASDGDLRLIGGLGAVLRWKT